MTPRLPVPASIDEIGDSWLTAALAPRFPDLRVDGHTSQRIGVDFGLASLIHRIEIGGEAPSVVVKLWDTTTTAGTGEIDFYTRFGNDAGIRVPDCYHADADPDSGRGVLVLEDLTPCRQGDNNDTLHGPDRSRVVDAMAGFHARWWGPAVLAATGVTSAFRLERPPGWIRDRRRVYLADRGPPASEVLRRIVEGAEDLVPAAERALGDATPTLLHRDLHLDNVVFIEPGGSPCFLDWTRLSVGPAARTVAQLAFQLSPAGTHLEVIDRYLDTLGFAGVRYRRSDAERHLDAALLLEIVIWTLGTARWQPSSPREETMILRSLSRAGRAADRWSEHRPGWPEAVVDGR